MQALREAVCETIENMLFFEAIRSDQPPPDPVDQDYWSRLEVFAPFPGHFVLRCPTALGNELTEALFAGADSDKDLHAEQTVRDALSEILNTVAGRLMSKLSPENESYILSVPSSGRGRPETSAQAPVEHFLINEKSLSLVIEGEALIGALRSPAS